MRSPNVPLRRGMYQLVHQHGARDLRPTSLPAHPQILDFPDTVTRPSFSSFFFCLKIAFPDRRGSASSLETLLFWSDPFLRSGLSGFWF